MPLCYSNFKSFRNKSSRIFWFEQLLFSKVDKLTCKGQVGLGLTGKGPWRANTGCNQLSDAIGNSPATSIKIEGCPCKLWQPYCTLHITIATMQYSINETQTNCLVDSNETYKRVVLLMVSVNKTICNNPQTAFKGISKWVGCGQQSGVC